MNKLEYNHYFASCARGLEEALTEELQNLGIRTPQPTRGGVHFKAPHFLIFKVLLNSRIASRIYKKLISFLVEDENDLYKKSFKLPWNRILNENQTFKIKVLLSSSPNRKKRTKFKNSLFLTYKIKDALVDSFQRRKRRRPNVELKFPDLSLLAFISPEAKPHSQKEEVSLLLDISGFPLYQRGYRTEKFEAPLKENLAAGLIALTGWDKKSPLVDFMCGSGSFLTEGLMMASQLSPHHLKKKTRHWAFLKHLWFTENSHFKDSWEKEVQTAPSFIKPPLVYGSDQSPQALNIVKMHLKNLELSEYASICQESALKALPPCQEKGLAIINPPYGERIGSKENLALLYKELGDHLKKNWTGWKVFMIIGDLDLVKRVGLKAHKKHIVFNGGLECRFVEYRLF